MTVNQAFDLPTLKPQRDLEAPVLCRVTLREGNKTRESAGEEKRKAQNDQIILGGTGGGIGAPTVEETSPSHPNREDLLLGDGGSLDREREDRRESRGRLKGGVHRDQEREDGRKFRGRQEDATHLDKERNDRRQIRGQPEGGCQADRQREDRGESRPRLEGEGLSQRRDLFLQPCRCLNHLNLEENLRSRGILARLHLICEVS